MFRSIARHAWCAAVAGLGMCGAAGSVAAGNVWQQDWQSSGPVFDSVDPANFGYQDATVDGSGGLFKVDSQPMGYTLLRLWQDGSLRWQASFPGERYRFNRGLFAYDDGSAALLQVALGDSGGRILRLDAQGQLLWSLVVPAARLIDTGSSLLAIGCRGSRLHATTVDLGSGAVLAQQAWPQPACTEYGDIQATLAGNDLFVATYRPATSPEQSILSRIAVQQSELVWSVAMPLQSGRMRVAAGNLYAVSGEQLRAVAVTDGALQWEKPCSGGAAGFIGGDVICVEGQSRLKRLAAADGSEVWTVAGALSVIGVLDADVYAYAEATGAWRRISGQDGQVLWEHLLQPALSRPPLLVSHVTSVATLFTGASPAQFALKRFSLAAGLEQGSAALPQVTRAIRPRGFWLDGDDLFIRSEQAFGSSPPKTSRLAAQTGAVVWENSSTSSMPLGVSTYDPAGFAASAATVFLSDELWGSKVHALDRGTGQTRWSRNLSESGSASLPTLLALADGDVISLTNAQTSSGSAALLTHKAQRLAAASGLDVWSRTLWSREGYMTGVPPRAVSMAGQFVVASPADAPTFPMQRVDAASGTLLWSNPLRADWLAASPVADAIFSQQRTWAQDYAVSRTNAATGAVEWTLSGDLGWTVGFTVHSLLPLPDGDVLVIGDGVFGAVTPGQPFATRTQLLRIKADGSGLRYAWPAEQDLSASYSTAKSAVLSADGQSVLLHLERQAGKGMALALGFLVRFDLQQDRPLGSQIYTISGAHPRFQTTAWDPRLMPYGDKFIASGLSARAPLISTRRDALRDFTVGRRGDLALDIPGLPAHFQAGTVLPVDARVNYDGDGPLADVTLLLDLPWQGTADGLSCGGFGVSNCTVDSRYGQIEVRFDAAPGARLRLAGAMRALTWPSAAGANVSGVVFGPEELLESEGTNNIRHATPGDVVFLDGFGLAGVPAQ